jgi:RHS repeat-associated protein
MTTHTFAVPRNVMLFVLCLVASSLSRAVDAPGIAPHETVENRQYDTINMQSLNITFDVPILTRQGRIPFSFAFVLNSYFTGSTQNGLEFHYKARPRDSGLYFTGTVSHSDRDTTCPDNQTPDHINEFWTYEDAHGTVHNFPGKTDSEGCRYGSSFTGAATDNSGYTLVVTNEDRAVVYTPSGVKQVPPVLGGAGHVSDANGNKLDGNYLSGIITYTDTTGSTALTYDNTQSLTRTATYTDSAGNPQTVTIAFDYRTIQTAFGCASPIVDLHGITSPQLYLAKQITFADGTSISNITYEPTPGATSNTTGRITGYTLPTGGRITYAYSGGSNGINCSSSGMLTTNTLTRTTPSGSWVYVHDATANTTRVTDPAGNLTTYKFYGRNEVQRTVYQGTTTPLETIITCYNGNTDPSFCANPTGAAPTAITRRTVFTQIPNATGVQKETDLYFDSYSNVLQQHDYDFGSGAVGPLLRRTITSYGSWNGTSCDSLAANYINNHPCQITVLDGLGAQVALTNFRYDQTGVTASVGTPQLNASITGPRGNPTEVDRWVSGTTYLVSHSTFYDTGMLKTSTDVNGAVTTYNYSSSAATCGNAFPDSLSLPLGLTKSTQWNCRIAQATRQTDENGQATLYAYNDPRGRLTSITDPLLNLTTYTYTSNTRRSSMVFNNGASVNETLTTLDSLGRTQVVQKRQGPSSALYDTVSTTYSWGSLGAVEATSAVPCSKGAGVPCPATPTKTVSYDALGRPLSVAVTNGASITSSYFKNNILTTIGPAPAGELVKSKQTQIDGLGRLKSVCEITSGTGSGTCMQTTNKVGFWTTYSYDAFGRTKGVTQNAQTASPQTRAFAYDGIGRLISETNPESGQSQYFWDSAPTTPGVACSGTYNGDQVKKYDANGNTSCFSYDALHRGLQVTYPGGPNATSTKAKFFVYDTQYQGVGSNLGGRLAAAATCQTNTSCAGTAVVLEQFGYSVRGEATDIWEATPHSGAAYHTTMSYFANGAINTLSGIPGQATFTYGLDSEGRAYSMFQGTTSYVNNVSFNAADQPLTISLGLGDSDNYAYDPNTGQMTSFTFTVGATPKSQVGSLTWNANGTLRTVAVTDGFNLAGNNTCNYGTSAAPGYDELGRLVKVDCGAAVWQQNFSYDAYGDLTKTVPTGGTGINWNPGYTSNNRYTSGSGATYDANGNLTNDTFHTYTWDANGHPLSIGSTTLIYDALGRVAEKNVSGVYTEFLYGPTGKLGLMNGQTLVTSYIPLPGGTTLSQSAGTATFQHKDWLGTVRLASSRNNRTITFDTAYAPFGETFNTVTGSSSLAVFTGDAKDTVTDEYDTPARELHPNQGRWILPDPAGMAAVDPRNPQSWNRYAYVSNNPLNSTDPTGTAKNGGTPCCADGLHWSSDENAYFVTGSDLDPLNDNTLVVVAGSDPPPSNGEQESQQEEAQNNGWSLSWQVNASARFLGQELKGVYDTTLAPVVDAASHPVQTVENAASNLVEGVKDVAKDPKGTLTGAAEGAKDLAVQLGSKVASGDPRAIGQAAGLVVDAYIAVRGVQGKEIKVNDNLRIAPAGNRTGGVGELPHYHRRIVGPEGKTVPGGGIGWHRPWEP